MNVLMVIERYIPIWGGAENQLRQLCPHLIAAGCNIEIVTRRWHHNMEKQELVDGVLVHRIGIPGTSVLAKMLFVVMLIDFLLRAGRRTDIYHSHGAVKMGAICWLVAVICRKKNVAKIATAGHISQLLKSSIGRIILYMFKRSSAIISMTSEIESELSNIRVTQEKIIHITNGVNCKRFCPVNSKQKNVIRDVLGIPQNAIVMLFSSRLVYRKGLDTLIKAWPEINSHLPQAYLLILGSGTDQQDSVAEEMEAKVRDEKLKNILFLGETTKPEKYLSAADCFLFPSRKEGFPNALMEAMASELPCVASQIGGVKDIITDGVDGVFFELENSSMLTEKCLSLFVNRQESVTIRIQARKNMLENFSFEIISARYLDLYRTLCD